MLRLFLIVTIVICPMSPVFGQAKSVAPQNRQERLTAVVPLVGSGTYLDPKRPLHVPHPKDMGKAGGLTSFSYEISDDGKSAIVEFVGSDRKAFAAILADKSVSNVFEKGRVQRSSMEVELQKVKKSYKLKQHGDAPRAELRVEAGK